MVDFPFKHGHLGGWVAEQVDSWYIRQAYRIFHEQTQSALPRFACHPLPDFELQVQKLEAQWVKSIHYLPQKRLK